MGVRPCRDPRDGAADVQRQEPGPNSVGPALCPRASKPSAPEHRPFPGPRRPSLPPRSPGQSSPEMGVMGPRVRAPAARGLQLLPSGLALPWGGRMWAPRGRPEPSGPGTSPGQKPARAPQSRTGRARSGGSRRAGPRGARSPSSGGRCWGARRAGRAGRGAAARYSPEPGLCIQGPGPSERGAHGEAGGWGAGLTSPKSPEAAEQL